MHPATLAAMGAMLGAGCVPAPAPSSVPRRKIKVNGSKPCDGGCGKPVSANKNKCLDCLEKEVAFRLKVGGIEASSSEIRRELYAQIGR